MIEKKGREMREDEKLKFFLSEKLFKLILDKKTPFEEKKEQIDYLIRLGADVNTNVYGKSLASWAKVLGNEEIVKYIKENGGVENQISKEDAEILGKQFWDDDGRIKSVDEIKELVLMGANLGTRNSKGDQIWRILSIDKLNEILESLPKGYVIENDINLCNLGLKELPNFSETVVTGNFNCSATLLKDLKGAPREVGGNFECNCEFLESLCGAPERVGGGLSCSYTQLKDLIGAPKEIGYGVLCIHSKLTSLRGAPEKINTSFNCDHNQLKDLTGAPKEVGDSFVCSENELTSLNGGPSKVGGYFDCSRNQLTDLKGAPREVGKGFNCGSNQLTTLEGGPSKVGGYFDCSWNELENLKHSPVMVGENFQCLGESLTSLEGKPIKIGGKFIIDTEVLEKIRAKTKEEKKNKKNISIFKRIFDKSEER